MKESERKHEHYGDIVWYIAMQTAAPTSTTLASPDNNNKNNNINNNDIASIRGDIDNLLGSQKPLSDFQYQQLMIK